MRSLLSRSLLDPERGGAKKTKYTVRYALEESSKEL